MTLRRRLALTLVVGSLPLVAGLAWIQDQLSQRAEEEAARGFVLAHMDERGRERCEADPAHLGEPPWGRVPPGEPPPEPPGGTPGARSARGRRPFLRPVALYAYDASFHAANPSAPALDASVRQALGDGADLASASAGEGRLVAVRMAWDAGPCAIVVAWRTHAHHNPALPGLLATALVLGAGALAAIWLAAGPVVRRIHGLASDVRRSAASGYAAPVAVTGADEVAELARAFNDAAAAVRAQIASLQERDATLRRFLANTTHDLMLPLTVLQGHLSQLQRGVDASRPEAALLVAAAEETAYIGSLLSNLGVAAKLEAGEPTVQADDVDLAALVERVVERQRPIASARGIEINYAVPEAPLLTVGDVTLIEQAASNLVHNAVRHNRTGGHVAVVLDEVGAGGFLLSVCDDGPGVAPDQIARLGERLFRTDEARQRSPEGLGLGLSIVREVARRHRFELRFHANQPTGLVVELAGPATRTTATAPQDPAPKTR